MDLQNAEQHGKLLSHNCKTLSFERQSRNRACNFLTTSLYIWICISRNIFPEYTGRYKTRPRPEFSLLFWPGPVRPGLVSDFFGPARFDPDWFGPLAITAQYCTVLSSTAQYCTVLYSTVQYCTVLYSTVQYCTDRFRFRPVPVHAGSGSNRFPVNRTRFPVPGLIPKFHAVSSIL